MIPDPTTRSCVTADEAFAELGIDRTTGYRAIQEGTFPVPVIRIGRCIRVPVAPLMRLLDPLCGPDLYDPESTASGQRSDWWLGLMRPTTNAARPSRPARRSGST